MFQSVAGTHVDSSLLLDFRMCVDVWSCSYCNAGLNVLDVLRGKKGNNSNCEEFVSLFFFFFLFLFFTLESLQLWFPFSVVVAPLSVLGIKNKIFTQLSVNEQVCPVNTAAFIGMDLTQSCRIFGRLQILVSVWPWISEVVPSADVPVHCSSLVLSFYKCFLFSAIESIFFLFWIILRSMLAQPSRSILSSVVDISHFWSATELL